MMYSERSRTPLAVLVTAGCGGLGRGITEHLFQKGWKVFPTTRDLSTVKREKKESQGRGIFPVELSFEDFYHFSTELEEIFDFIESCGFLLSGVVHCAASRLPQKPLEELSEEDWLEEFKISLIRFSQLALSAASRMEQHKIQGSLVAISSIYGHHAIDKNLYDTSMLEKGFFSGIPYAISKAGMEHLVRCLALEFGRDGVRVNAVAPGGIENPETQTGYFRKKYVERTPLRRLGKSSDIPGAVAYLLSEDAAYLTGHVLPVDGGWCAR